MAKKVNFSYKGLQFDSGQQISVYCWMQQAYQNNLVESFDYHPDSFILYQGSKFGKKSLLRPHIYTADYAINLNINKLDKRLKLIFKYTQDFQSPIFIDVKGGFSKFHDASKFSVNQKWVHQKHGIYVYKIQPDILFSQSFVPQYSRYTLKKRQLRQKYANMLTISEFIDTHET